MNKMPMTGDDWAYMQYADITIADYRKVKRSLKNLRTRMKTLEQEVSYLMKALQRINQPDPINLNHL